MDRTTEKLTPKQEAFLTALLVAPSVAEAARASGVALTTAHRWLGQPQVHRAWLEMRRQVVDQAMMTVQKATSAAVATLLACLQPKMPPGVRVRAATAILDTAIRAVELGDLAQRIEELEAAVAAHEEREGAPQRRLYA